MTDNAPEPVPPDPDWQLEPVCMPWWLRLLATAVGLGVVVALVRLWVVSIEAFW